MKTYQLKNDSIQAEFLAYGAVLHKLWVKDKNGNPINVIMGLSQPEDYLSDSWSRGAVIGRFAGRLENPIQILDQKISIENNEGVLLHSGGSGWNKKIWEVDEHHSDKIQFSIHCPKGSSGFPGTVKAWVSYTLEDVSLSIHYQAITDESTHINLTNHAYFNLNPKGKIADQILKINADQMLELKETLVPTGVQNTVEESPYDFRKKRAIGQTQLDDYFIVKQNGEALATLYSKESGIKMSTHSNQPGVVVFTPPHFEAICFETQKFSNSPNIPHFPTTLIRPEDRYDHQTRFEFSVKDEC